MDSIISGFILEWIQIFGDSIFSGFDFSGFILGWIPSFGDRCLSGFAFSRIQY